MPPVDSSFPPRQRARLAEKGRILYGKACGKNGGNSCLEGFALHHLRRGELEIVSDLLGFLEKTAEALRVADPDGRLEQTKELADWIRVCLNDARAEASFPQPALTEVDEGGKLGP
jgi:hypothetical protein